jgi:tRNA threonylcarbamoyladenosine biosynthesis protein TsaE
MDLYRLSDEDELEAIGFRDFLWPEGLVLMEWADRIPSAQAAASWTVELSDEGPEQRRLCFRSSPQRLTVLQSRVAAHQGR